MAYVIPVLSDFRTMFPELANYTDDQVNFWLAKADPFFDQNRWDDMLFLGMLYWTAHQLAISNANSTQQITDDGIMKKVGDIAKTREAQLMNKQADDPYYRTTYGQMFRSYRELVGAGGYSGSWDCS